MLLFTAFITLPLIQPVRAGTFSDVNNNDWFYPYVEEMTAHGYVDPGQYYRPQDYLTRAEMTKLMTLAFNLEAHTSDATTFKDTPDSAWYSKYTTILSSQNIINGYIDEKGNPTGYFGPGDFVTREQAAKIIVLSSKLNANANEALPFYDVQQNQWSYSYIFALYDAGIINGYPDNGFHPHEFINRAEIAAIISKTIAKDHPPENIPRDTSLNNLIQTFQNIRTATVFPVQGKTINDIESGFGPRIQNSTGLYDWHRGIDIDAALGTPVVSIMDGEFLKINEFDDGGTTVTVKHRFPAPVRYKDKELDYYYTLYMHLDGIATKLSDAQEKDEHPQIAKGEQIGTVGHSGSSVDHLHLDLRIGTYCSLEYQLANPTFDCAKNFIFDPHMNPMYLFSTPVPAINLELPATLSKNQDTTMRFTSPDEQLLLNRIEYFLGDNNTGQITASHILDYNQRTGYNPASNASLDIQDKLKPYVSPVIFTDKSDTFAMDIVIPKEFVKDLHGNHSYLTVKDIWNNSKSIEWDW